MGVARYFFFVCINFVNSFTEIQFCDQVSEVSRNIDEVSSQDNKMMLQDLSNMLQVSDDGKIEVNKYIEKAKARFTEDTFISTETQALLENSLEEW